MVAIMALKANFWNDATYMVLRGPMISLCNWVVSIELQVVVYCVSMCVFRAI